MPYGANVRCPEYDEIRDEELHKCLAQAGLSWNLIVQWPHNVKRCRGPTSMISCVVTARTR